MKIDPAHVYRATLTSTERSLRRDLFVADALIPSRSPAAEPEATAHDPTPAVIAPEVTAPPAAPAVAVRESRDLITLAPIALRPEDAAPARAADGPGLPRYGYDVRAMSPRQMASLSLDLYVDGILTWDEYSMLAFQPELHPDYDQTIGALIGEPAQPDKPRDYVELWRDRLGFERRYSAHNPDAIQRSERIVHVLSMIETPTQLVA